MPGELRLAGREQVAELGFTNGELFFSNRRVGFSTPGLVRRVLWRSFPSHTPLRVRLYIRVSSFWKKGSNLHIALFYHWFSVLPGMNDCVLNVSNLFPSIFMANRCPALHAITGFKSFCSFILRFCGIFLRGSGHEWFKTQIFMPKMIDNQWKTYGIWSFEPFFPRIKLRI